MNRAFSGALLLCAACASAPPAAPPRPEPPVTAASVAAAPPDPALHVMQSLRPAVEIVGEDVRYSLEARMRELHIHAVSVAVFENYELKWARAYGLADAEAGTAATPATLFQAGSISKSVNALAALQAVAEGKLSLDGPINDSLVSWKLPKSPLTDKHPVTLRQLLSHTAGTNVHGFAGYVAGAPIPTVPQVLDALPPANSAPVRVELAPDDKFQYSGGGITIAQLALTDQTKQPYPALLQARVLGPLGMSNSTFEQPLPAERIGHAAVGYRADGNAIEGKRNVYPEMAAAGLWTTPTDLARFFVEIQLALAHRSSRVSTEIADQMTTRAAQVSGDSKDGVGLGVFLATRNRANFFMHSGADEGFQADALASMEGGYGIVVMASSDNGCLLFPEIERAIFAEYNWKGRTPALPRVVMDPARRAAMVGLFTRVGEVPTLIRDDAGCLQMRRPFREPVEIVPIANDTVVVRETGQRLTADPAGYLKVGMPESYRREILNPQPPNTKEPLFELEAGRFDDAAAAWRERVRLHPKSGYADERAANHLAYEVVATDPSRAREILRLVVAVYPASSNAHDSLGEVYLLTGDRANAKLEYQRALDTLEADTHVPDADKPERRKHAQTMVLKASAPATKEGL